MGATQIDSSGKTSDPQMGPKSETAADEVQSEPISEDDLFELLSNQRRRYILDELLCKEQTLEIGPLAQGIAAHEDGLEYQEVSSKDRKRVYTALQQSHLPKMDKAGIVDFDRDRGTVRPTPALEDIEIYMDVVHGRELPWSDYYLGLTLLSGLLFAAATLGIGPFVALSLSAWGTFVIVTFGVFSLTHRYYDRQNRLGIDEDSSGLEYSYGE